MGGVHNVGLPEGTAGLRAGFPAAPAGPGLARGAEEWEHRPGGEAWDTVLEEKRDRLEQKHT